MRKLFLHTHMSHCNDWLRAFSVRYTRVQRLTRGTERDIFRLELFQTRERSSPSRENKRLLRRWTWNSRSRARLDDHWTPLKKKLLLFYFITAKKTRGEDSLKGYAITTIITMITLQGTSRKNRTTREKMFFQTILIDLFIGNEACSIETPFIVVWWIDTQNFLLFFHYVCGYYKESICINVSTHLSNVENWVSFHEKAKKIA